jgi:Outer membrane protein beta-barrel domain
MKKFLQAVLYSCLFVSATFAQMRTTMGVRAGVNVATYAFKSDSPSPSGTDFPIKNATLLTVGLPFEMIFSDNFAIQGELNYVQKGFKFNFDFDLGQGSSFKSNSTLAINWLEIPIMAKIKFGSPVGVSGGLFFGPSIGYAFSGKSKGTSTVTQNGLTTTSSDSQPVEFDKKTGPNGTSNGGHSRLDIGLNIGGELNVSGVFLDVRYQLGLTDMATGKTSTATTTETAKTRGIALTLGYRFPIGVGTVKEVKTKKK